MPALQLTLLGSFAAHWKGKTITSFPTDKVRALLAYLALEGERPLRRETVAILLWPTTPTPSPGATCAKISTASPTYSKN